MYIYIFNYSTQIHRQSNHPELDPYDADLAVGVYPHANDLYYGFQLDQRSSFDQVVHPLSLRFHPYSSPLPLYQVLDSVYALQLPAFARAQMRRVLFVDSVGDRVYGG